MQPPDQVRVRVPTQSQPGQERAAIGVELRRVGPTDVVLGPGRGSGRPGGVRPEVEAGAVPPAGQPDQHFEGLVHALAEQPGLAFGTGVEHLTALAQEVGPAGVVPGHRLQGRSGRQPYGFTVLGTIEVEVERERREIGQLPVPAQQFQGAIKAGHGRTVTVRLVPSRLTAAAISPERLPPRPVPRS
ncbi:hypothetical protein GCM10025734_81090 [Kitasatospora paranensis]